MGYFLFLSSSLPFKPITKIETVSTTHPENGGNSGLCVVPHVGIFRASAPQRPGLPPQSLPVEYSQPSLPGTKCWQRAGVWRPLVDCRGGWSSREWSIGCEQLSQQQPTGRRQLPSSVQCGSLVPSQLSPSPAHRPTPFPSASRG